MQRRSGGRSDVRKGWKRKMNTDFFEALEELEKEKGIDKDIIIKALEDAVTMSYDKKSGDEPRASEPASGTDKKRRVEFDRETKELRVYMQKTIVEKVEDENTQISLEEVRKEDPDFELGEVVEVDVTPSDFECLGRIVAQQVKSTLIQQLKEKEREILCEEYRKKVGEVVTCVIQNIEEYEYRDRKTNRSEIRRNIHVQVGKIDGIIEHADQIPGEEYKVNAKCKVYVLELKERDKEKDKKKGKGSHQKANREPRLRLSRTHENLIKRLLEQEVVEIASGIVEIKSIARKPGQRSKIAVVSHNPKVDPVSACVGEKGGRIQCVVDELCNERIDVIRWSPLLEEFVRNSLSPAHVSEEHPIIIEEEESFEGEKRLHRKIATVVVPDDQLTLAIGNRGLNVSLAAKLTNCKIDIKSEKDETERNREMLSALLGEQG